MVQLVSIPTQNVKTLQEVTNVFVMMVMKEFPKSLDAVSDDHLFDSGNNHASFYLLVPLPATKTRTPFF